MDHDIFAATEDSSPDVLRVANIHGFMIFLPQRLVSGKEDKEAQRHI